MYEARNSFALQSLRPVLRNHQSQKLHNLFQHHIIPAHVSDLLRVPVLEESVLQCIVVRCSVLQWVAVRCSLLHCVVVCVCAPSESLEVHTQQHILLVYECFSCRCIRMQYLFQEG